MQLQKDEPLSAKFEWTIPLIFAAVACFSHIHQGTIAVDAIRYSAIASWIVETGDWLHLYDRFTDSAYGNKPPLLFWMLAVFFKAFGFSTFFAKLPAVLFTFGAMILIWAIGRRIGGAASGLWALLLFTLNRNFFRDLVELGFDGIAACGALLCMWAGLVAFENPHSRKAKVTTAIGILLLLQSKPPYVLLVAAPLIFSAIRWRIMPSLVRSLGWWLAWLLPFFPTILWYSASGSIYLSNALDNQLAEPFRHSGTYLENLAHWMEIVFVDFVPAVILGLLFAVWEYRRAKAEDRPLDFQTMLLIAWLAMAIPIILIVANRPRYLSVPMLAAVLLGAKGLTSQIPQITASALQRVMLSVALIGLILIVAFGVRVHRHHPFIALLDGEPAEARSEFCYCVDGDMAHRHERMARYTGLLLELHYDFPARVYTSESLSESARRGECRLVVNNECHRSLVARGVRTKAIKQARGAAILLLKE